MLELQIRHSVCKWKKDKCFKLLYSPFWGLLIICWNYENLQACGNITFRFFSSEQFKSIICNCWKGMAEIVQVMILCLQTSTLFVLPIYINEMRKVFSWSYVTYANVQIHLYFKQQHYRLAEVNDWNVIIGNVLVNE